MRQVRLSRTFHEQLEELLEHGFPRFGVRVILEKRDRAYDAINLLLAQHPGIKRPDPHHGLVAYPITRTPFVVLYDFYDFDDQELRVHFIFRKSADLHDLDPKTAEW